MNKHSPNISTGLSRPGLSLLLVSQCLACLLVLVFCQRAIAQQAQSSIPNTVMVRIIRAEDERRWDADLQTLLADKNTAVRRRAALAAGRIGDERALPLLISLLQKDSNISVRAMVAFALGEIESAGAAESLIAALNPDHKEPAEIRARAIEALGKIAAAIPKSEEARAVPIRKAILDAVDLGNRRRSQADRQVLLLGLTAALRARPENAGKVIAACLHDPDARIRADAENTLARLKQSDGNAELRKLVAEDPDPIVRANAARVLSATEDKAAFDVLVDRALKDPDSRVRASAIRALSSLKDARAAEPLLRRGLSLAAQSLSGRPTETNEVLEIATTLGRLLQGTENKEAISWLRRMSRELNQMAPEIEIAFARISPGAYLAELGAEGDAKRKVQTAIMVNWKAAAGVSQGLGEIAALPDPIKNKDRAADRAQELLRAILDYRNAGFHIDTLVAVHSEYAIPDVLQALAKFKPADMAALLRGQLRESDVIIRGTAAELLGELQADESNARALSEALPLALQDKALNDAALAILGALGKQKSASANEAIKTGLDSSDHLIRRRAVNLLKANGAGDFSDRVGPVKTSNTAATYQRAVGRIGKRVRATVNTDKGVFVIEFLPEDAPLTVDNFVMLATKKYFNGQTVPRVVPNFVIQTGDPRGDQNGGPGYQIRCEINEASYQRGAVGMALSGKDTGGSQWFVTHSPQPHLDGGYTVFGRVISGLDVIDRIVRGDIIRSITISESARRASNSTAFGRNVPRGGKRE
jgi:cyclophilin family peptidyl-prolyl cis-trans isomerase/HEAT repeat protein